MKALVLVDIQNDFMPGGALGVPDGDAIIPVINDLLGKSFDVVTATKDWHPKDHGSFASSHKKKPGDHIKLDGLDQILWPVHCVQNTEGSDFAPDWDPSAIDRVFFKGVDKNVDSYSAFFDNTHRRSTGLAEYLIENGITDVYIAVLATDYCVKHSALDALKAGFKVYVIEDACRGINLKKGDVQKALEEMRKMGADVIQSDEINSHSKR